MTKIITAIALFVCSFLTAQAQYEEGMGKALGLWKEGKPTEASALFERIASAEKDSWLPNYYVALVNTTEAFNPANKEKISALLAKAQSALDVEMLKDDTNPELLVVQAMINTAWIVNDPMVNGMKLSAPTIAIYNKALALDPNNPRVVFCKAEFEIGGAKWSGADVKSLCKDVEKSIELFKNYKTEVLFYPNWGLDRAQQTLKNCGK